MKQIICCVYRSTKKEGMYLYLEKSRGLKDVPQGLLDIFGKPAQALTLLLTAEKKLAHADVAQVMSKLESQGYYLQMPPQAEAYMQVVNEKNTRL